MNFIANNNIFLTFIHYESFFIEIFIILFALKKGRERAGHIFWGPKNVVGKFNYFVPVHTACFF